jgi:hypothetical protein
MSGCGLCDQGSVTDKIRNLSQVGPALVLPGLLFSRYLGHFRERVKGPGHVKISTHVGRPC